MTTTPSHSTKNVPMKLKLKTEGGLRQVPLPVQYTISNESNCGKTYLLAALRGAGLAFHQCVPGLIHELG